MKKDRWQPGRSFFGGKCGFFGGSNSMAYSREPRESMWQFFNRILYNRGSIEQDSKADSLIQKFNRLLFNRGNEGDS